MSKDIAISDPKNIIIRMPNWVGDLVMSTAIIVDVKKKYPNSKITVLCKHSTKALLENNPNVDEILSFKKSFLFFLKKEGRRIIRLIKEKKYDLGILLTNSFSSAYLFFFGKVKFKIGFKSYFRNFFLDHALPLPKDKFSKHFIKTYQQLIGLYNSSSLPEISIGKNDKEKTRELLIAKGYKDKQILIGIHPGATYGKAKCWLPNRFYEVAKKLSEKNNITIVFLGDNSQSLLIKEICKNLPPRVIDLSGKTSLKELISIISNCDVVVTNDSGPMHIASALNIPLVALFGSTSSVMTGPYNGGIVINKNVKCSPCFKRKCPKDFICMKKITANEVYDEILKLLENKNV